MPEQGRMLHIDSIRGIAALLVAYMHISAVFINLFPAIKENGTLLKDIAYMFDFGRIGVIAFFAISGFVICNSLKGDRVQGSKKFLISRAFRLFPAYWVSMGVAICVMFILRNRAIDHDQVIANLTLIPSLFNQTPIQGLYWTLEVELIFYILCYISFLFSYINKPLFLYLTCIFLVVVQQAILSRPPLLVAIDEYFAPHWRLMPLHLGIMFWGGLYRIYYDEPQKYITLMQYKIPVVALVIASGLILVSRHIYILERGVLLENLLFFKQGISYILGIGLFVIGAQFVRLKGPVFTWLGKISYSLYLLHPAVFSLVIWLLKKYGTNYDHYHLAVYIMLCLGISIALSSLVYIVVEKPFINVSKRFTLSKKKPHL